MLALGAIGRIGRPERAVLQVAAMLAALALVFWSTSASMVSVWRTSNTYSHGFFVVPAFLWMVWSRRQALAVLLREPSWWGPPTVAAIGLVWLLADWMAFALPAQIAVVAMLPAALAGVMGVGWVRALLFPLAFLLFAVPFGESLVPVLMDWTADFTVAALRLSGVPVYRDGLHFDIPSGKWSVVDSCSGIRYVFACLALSSLYGWTIYRRTTRRLAFLALALAIAIGANWLRAYGIVMLGHLSDNAVATGADHLVYGALFFTAIMGLVFALGAVWHEKGPATADDEAVAPAVVHAAAAPRAAAGAAAALATLVAVLAWPLLAIAPRGSEAAEPVAPPDLASHSNWVRVAQAPANWQPELANPAAATSVTFANADKVVGVHIGVFGRSTSDSKLTASLNRLLAADGRDPRWALVQQGQATASWGGRPFSVKTGVLSGDGGRLLAWRWYWVDGEVTANPLRAAALQLRARLRGSQEASAWIAVYTLDAGPSGSASLVLQEFVAEMARSIDAALRYGATRGGEQALRR